MQGNVVEAARWLGACLVIAAIILAATPFLTRPPEPGQKPVEATETRPAPPIPSGFHIDLAEHLALRIKLAEKEAEIRQLQEEARKETQRWFAHLQEEEEKRLKRTMLELLD